MFLTAISLAVAAIPEALPAVVTISLALGANKMVRRHALIRRLPAVETLGSVTYICTDKTGTLTQNRMHVEEIYSATSAVHDVRDAPQNEPWQSLLTALSLSNDAQHGRHGKPVGDPTETALYQAALDAGYDKATLEQAAPRSMELPFDSERKRMTTLHRQHEGFIAYTKGAPESVLPLCDTLLGENGTEPLPCEHLLAVAEQMASEGLRVLAVARRHWPELPDVGTDFTRVEAQLEFLGLVGMMDPPRREAHHAVELCRSAGITPVMITGDHPATARAIAARIGIEAGSVMTGTELALLGDTDFLQRVGDIRVYARVDPAQKIRIVEALQTRGEFVAMTGDGVNDAPAIKRADIGIAMGKEGTDVAREASSLVLLDENFSTIVSAVSEGRRIYDNIRKFIKYTMTSNSGEVLTIFLAPFLGLPIPLLPIHILWINLVTDGLPALALATDPVDPDVLARPPREPSAEIMDRGFIVRGALIGCMTAAVSLTAFAYELHATGSPAAARSAAFFVLVTEELLRSFGSRSMQRSMFEASALSSLRLLAIVAGSFVLQLVITQNAALQPIFGTRSLSLAECAEEFMLAALPLILLESAKFTRRMMRRAPAS